MKFYKAISLLVLFSLLSACGVIKSTPSSTINKLIEKADENYPDDNYIEEKVEDGIKTVTGLDVDLSPRSPEKK